MNYYIGKEESYFNSSSTFIFDTYMRMSFTNEEG